MSFPTGTVIDTTNLSSGTADPSLARSDLYNMAVAVNSIIAGADAASGVALLTATNQYDGSKFPTTIACGVIAPSNGRVNIQDVLRLTVFSSTNLNAVTGSQLGDIAMSSDAASGNAAVCFYDGSHWRALALSSLSVV
jgi:hypothetical protein